MDLQKTKILLEKVTALYKSMSADAQNVSSIERDLMKSYLQQLYDIFLHAPSDVANAEPTPVEVFKTTPKITLNKIKSDDNTPRVKTDIKEAPPRPAPPPPPPAPVPEPAPVVEKKEAPVVEVPKAQPEPIVPQPAAATPTPRANNEEMEDLFHFPSARELSEKLSELPITDIKKEMGLNERILTVNELFGGDQASFDATIATLNQLKSFDEAKDYLIRNVSRKYDWLAKDKVSKAKIFIKLVKRRYG